MFAMFRPDRLTLFASKNGTIYDIRNSATPGSVIKEYLDYVRANNDMPLRPGAIIATDFGTRPATIAERVTVPAELKAGSPFGENPKDRLGVLKLPLRLIPAPALAFLSRVMELGANKYGAFNWRSNAVKKSVYLEAILRHTLSVLDGEDTDPESGQPHEAHIMACAAILLDAKATGNLIDDRSKKGCFGELVQTMQRRAA